MNDKQTAARRKMAQLVMTQTGATLDLDPVVDFADRITFTGEQVECERVRAYMADELGVDGVTVDELDSELGTWTAVRVPLAALELRWHALRATARCAAR